MKLKYTEYDPEIAKLQCGQVGCKNKIEDWQDDLGAFFMVTPNGYVVVCKTCCGPLTGNR